MRQHSLMVQGTTSDAGKTTLVAGLGRALAHRGIHVAPFKPQNMALNSAVTVDGGEIGRAQAMQARACGLEAHSDMNPVLLKPTTDTHAQVIVQGRVLEDMDAWAYHQYKGRILSPILESYRRLQARYTALLIEGAGSPAEINLRDHDVANMGFAEAVDCPVVLVADIDRGGVFAHLVGTRDLLSKSEQARVKGFVINRFRGDKALLQPGLDWLEERTGVPVLGVLPYLQGLCLEAEDALPIDDIPSDDETRLRVLVPALPRISNHTDFDSWRLHPAVDLRFIGPGAAIPGADLIILPGSKRVRADRDWLRNHGWDACILRHLRYGGKLMGICGGLQMLGKVIHDPLGIEGEPGSTPGLGLLELETTLRQHKHLRRVEGDLAMQPANVSGYEIHAGESSGPALLRPAVHLQGRDDGAMSEDGQIFATYLHGLLDSPDACSALLAWAGLENAEAMPYRDMLEAQTQRLADAVEQHLDMDRILALMDL